MVCKEIYTCGKSIKKSSLKVTDKVSSQRGTQRFDIVGQMLFEVGWWVCDYYASHQISDIDSQCIYIKYFIFKKWKNPLMCATLSGSGMERWMARSTAQQPVSATVAEPGGWGEAAVKGECSPAEAQPSWALAVAAENQLHEVRF